MAGARGFVAVVGARVLPESLAAGPAACARSVVFLPGADPARGHMLQAFVERGGRVVPDAGRVGLLARSGRLARASAVVAAFLWGPSRGSGFTVREAIRAGKPAAVVLAGGEAALPVLLGGRGRCVGWVARRLPAAIGVARAGAAVGGRACLPGARGRAVPPTICAAGGRP